MLLRRGICGGDAIDKPLPRTLRNCMLLYAHGNQGKVTRDFGQFLPALSAFREMQTHCRRLLAGEGLHRMER
jgi:hypothetical protein